MTTTGIRKLPLLLSHTHITQHFLHEINLSLPSAAEKYFQDRDMLNLCMVLRLGSLGAELEFPLPSHLHSKHLCTGFSSPPFQSVRV